MTDITTVQEVASVVLDMIPDGSRWTKKAYEADSGRRHCIVGAVLCLRLDVNLAHDFYTRFREIVSSEYPERESDSCSCFVLFDSISFNDHPDTSYSDVRRVLEKVAAG